MREDLRDQGLQMLEELVLDAGEAVSYRRLASSLCFHVNKSKILLHEFAEKHPDLSVLYLVCGTTGGGNARTVLCQRDELNDAREALDSVLFEHVYAISRSKAALEGATLVNVSGGFDDFTSTIGAISSKACSKRSDEEIGHLKLNSFKTVSVSTACIPKVQIRDNNGKQNDIFTNPEKEKDQGSKIGETVKLIKQEAEPNVKSKEGSKSQAKSISNFFSKTNGQQAAKPATKVKDEQKDVKPKVEKLSPKKEGKVNSTEKSWSDKTPQTSKKESKKPDKSEEKKSSKNKEIVTAQRNGKIDKKRKRVLRISDSEDSDEGKNDPFEDQTPQDVNMESDEDVIPSTPNADIVKITSGIVNPKKRRKIVDKTYTTEDGYMVTRKEEVLESCSEDEVEMKENIFETNVKKEIVAEKKLAPSTPKSKFKKKIASPQKGKQASIMSFFQKK